MRILSLCTSAGLWDKAWLEAGHDVVPGCEIMAHKRAMYEEFCGGKHLCHDLVDLPAMVRGQHFDGIIGGIPCQSRSTMVPCQTRGAKPSIYIPKFGDLLHLLGPVMEVCSWGWYLYENVRPLDIPGAHTSKMDAMNYGQPHQARPRWFTHSPNLVTPPPVFPGSVDDLFAYPIVMGRVYGAKRGSRLQGWPGFASLVGKFKSLEVQEAIADGVPRGLADAWIRSIEGGL